MGQNHLYLLAALQWGIIAPLNLIKILTNTVSPIQTKYELFVSKKNEVCQGQCDIARMWASLFWSTQTIFAIGYLYIWRYNSGRMPFAAIGGIQKLVVGILLVKAYVEGVVYSPIAGGGVLDLVIGPLMLLDASAAMVTTEPFKEDEEREGSKRRTSTGMLAGIVDWLRSYAAQAWYPWVVGLLSGVNNFTVVFSAPLVVLFLSGVYANPKMRHITAFANAVGTTIGIALLIYLMESQGVSYIEATFPKQLESAVTVTTQKYWDEYGLLGAVIISMMPIFLQPLVFIGVMAKTSMATLVSCVLVGRTIKYIIMSELAIAAPHLLKYFGSAAVDASNKIRSENKLD
jgi:membrane protein YqaA with SNARE-associated domain